MRTILFYGGWCLGWVYEVQEGGKGGDELYSCVMVSF